LVKKTVKRMIKDLIRNIRPVVSLYHLLYAFLGAAFYRFPSSRMKVFAVTGTNGKTTTVDLVARVFKEAGFSVAALSSVKFEIAGKEEPNLYKMTMPGRAVVQKMLRKAADSGCQIAVIEVTSEGIKQHRHRFIKIDTACFTNLSPEHIESHGGFENYKKEKGKLFKAVKGRHVINIDDENADYFLEFPAKKKITYGVENEKALVKAKNISSQQKGVSFDINGENYFLGLSGKFNVYNALVAIALAKEEGVDIKDIKKALANMTVMPGRMEEVVSSPFKVIVDYAVTPVTLDTVYKEVKESFSPQNLICILGSCGGGRDKWKRPVLGEIADKYCDRVIVTNEDPYDEDPETIIDEVIAGTNSKGEKITDRREAIKEALLGAKKGDVIIITGKGSELWMCLAKGKKIPWNEKDIIKEELTKISL
jgi:UDP-N-acetylmuramoyl-L-alanyl-D-glutamate--2,6-diaminopimelate ligase